MTVKRLEAGEAIRPAQAMAIRRALEEAGVAFLGERTEWNGMQVRAGVVMLSGREPTGWVPSGQPPVESDEKTASASD